MSSSQRLNPINSIRNQEESSKKSRNSKNNSQIHELSIVIAYIRLSKTFFSQYLLFQNHIK